MLSSSMITAVAKSKLSCLDMLFEVYGVKMAACQVKLFDHSSSTMAKRLDSLSETFLSMRFPIFCHIMYTDALMPKVKTN